MKHILTLLVLITLTNLSFNANAQNQTELAAQQQAVPSPLAAAQTALKTFNADEFYSVLLLQSEYREIENARDLIGQAVTPYGQTEDSNKRKPLPEKRYINLQGILYSSKNDWIVWLNGKQIRPDALPEEALSMTVYKDHIELRWYDDYTNQIFPIRLKPLQRFHMDTRMFVPG